ncbi:hypothetical protein CRM22_000343 [Opisthorchis felineus]|uniref:Beta-lactamase-related domain-containing protein n=3 Tax=Opisthorchis felineus TaxID=147828 RepID=A0A4S2MFU0_OPIFE|nr:hypothetical protein CRM22_000343 [Opisthorchis felineus]
MRFPTILYAAAAALHVIEPSAVVDRYDGGQRITTSRSRLFPRQMRRRATSLIQLYKERSGCPGISVCISYAGECVYSEGFGFANVENLVPVREDTLFRIASISKSFTSVLVGRLMEQSKLDLDEDIRTYLPEFPEKHVDGNYAKITARSLLSHTSGIRSYRKSAEKRGQSSYPEMLLQTRYDNALDACNLFKDDPLVHAPGKQYTYSTFGFTLLSAAIENICTRSGPSFECYSGTQPNCVKKSSDTSKIPRFAKMDHQFSKLFTFLGLKNTFLEYHEKITPVRASQYKRNSKGVLENTPMVDNSYKWAGGGILSTAYDLTLFANHLAYVYLDSMPKMGVIKPETLRLLWTVSASNPDEEWQPGLGWFLCRRSGGALSQEVTCPDRLYVCHTGGAVGGTTILLLSLPCCKWSNGHEYVREDAPSNLCDFTARSAKLAPICVAILTNLEDASGIKDLAVSLVELVSDCILRER